MSGLCVVGEYILEDVAAKVYIAHAKNITCMKENIPVMTTENHPINLLRY